MTKLPDQFHDFFKQPRSLDEAMGQSLAEWASGGVKAQKTAPTPMREPGDDTPEETITKFKSFKDEGQSGFKLTATNGDIFSTPHAEIIDYVKKNKSADFLVKHFARQIETVEVKS